ncbi:MAG: hypothetical protein M3016_04855 [Actinomycetota bacterium]|nr:hypothetical protein [Actinomycetota bacterium]
MKRVSIILATAAALVPAAISQGASAPRPTRVKVAHRAVGSILVTRGGFTLYVFTRDGRNRDRCRGLSGCPGIWPALKTRVRPVAGHGVRSKLLSTIKLGGARQVTYAGHPLYMYVGDSGPGDTSYVGASQFGGHWYAINAAGRVVK